MNKNILYTIGIIITIVFYYLFFDYQEKKFISLDNKLKNLSNKMDTLLMIREDKKKIKNIINYKENNIVKDKIIDFADSLNQLLNSDTLITYKFKDIPQLDTFCYELSEDYKIISFYSNRIRIQNISKPGSFVLSVEDSILHKNNFYTLNEINGQGRYVRFHNLSNNSYCKLHKAKP